MFDKGSRCSNFNEPPERVRRRSCLLTGAELCGPVQNLNGATWAEQTCLLHLFFSSTYWVLSLFYFEIELFNLPPHWRKDASPQLTMLYYSVNRTENHIEHVKKESRRSFDFTADILFLFSAAVFQPFYKHGSVKFLLLQLVLNRKLISSGKKCSERDRRRYNRSCVVIHSYHLNRHIIITRLSHHHSHARAS